MEINEIYELLKETLCVQDKALSKLIWTLYHNFNGDFKQNILLIGEFGSGKTTMLKETADLMGIPFGEVYDMFLPDGMNVDLFFNGYAQMLNKSEDGRGIVLLHDFQDAFMSGGCETFNAMLSSGCLNLGNGFVDVSNVTFVGEIDTNYMEAVFAEERDLLKDFENGIFLSPTLNLIQDYLRRDNEIVIDEEGNKHVSLQFENYLQEEFRKRFLSKGCKRAFPRKIYMEPMDKENILKALNSPISSLKLYTDDLSEEYIYSDGFMKKLAYYIVESNEGLHAVMEAVEDTAFRDYKIKEKVLKRGSLMTFGQK